MGPSWPGGSAASSSIPYAPNAVVSASTSSAPAPFRTRSGRRTSNLPVAMFAIFSAGAMTSISRKATASVKVTWKPRRSFFQRGSGRAEDGDRAAITVPTANGTSSASAIQMMRSQMLGTDLESGTNEMTNSVTFGTTMPSRRSGQTAAAATTADSMVCSLGEVWPNSATTAQPKIALRIFPADLVMRLMSAWRMATCPKLGRVRHPWQPVSPRDGVRRLLACRRERNLRRNVAPKSVFFRRSARQTRPPRAA